MSEEKPPATVEDLLSEIQRKVNACGGKCIFRGEAEAYKREETKGCERDKTKACERDEMKACECDKAKKYRKISSTLYRAYKDILHEGDFAKNIVRPLTMDQLLQRNLRNAKAHTTEKDDKAILELIQHYGGDTNFIDFSHDYAIALFFACDGHHKRNGRLILYDTSRSKKPEVEIIVPSEPRERVIAQKSIFASPESGVLDVKKENIIIIPARHKKIILNFLRTHHNITARTIYNDIHGYIHQNNIHKEADKHLYRAYCYIEDRVKQDSLVAHDKGKWDNTNMHEYEEQGEQAYQKAIKACTKAIEINPQFAEAYCNRGVAYYNLKKYPEAIADLTMAIEIDPQFDTACYNRGNTYKKLREHEKALADFTTAIEINPQFAISYCDRGVVYWELHEYEKAIADYNKAIEINPQLAIAYYNRGLVYEKLHGYEKAITDYTMAIKIDPKMTDAHYNRGLTYEKLQEHRKAIADFTTAIEINPQFAAVYCDRGLAYRRLHDYEKAIADYNKAIEINPQFADAYSNRGVAYGKLHEYEKAIADCTMAIELNPQLAGAYYNRGFDYGELHDYEKAIADFTEAIQINPQFAEAYFGRGLVYQELEKYTQAIRDYDKVIEINPQMTAIYPDRALCYLKLASEEQNEEKRHILYENVLKDYYAVVKHNPNESNAYSLLFNFYYDFCSQAKKNDRVNSERKQDDSEEQQLRKRLKPITDRALQLAKDIGNKLLKEQVQEYYDIYCAQPPPSTPIA